MTNNMMSDEQCARVSEIFREIVELCEDNDYHPEEVLAALFMLIKMMSDLFNVPSDLISSKLDEYMTVNLERRPH